MNVFVAKQLQYSIFTTRRQQSYPHCQPKKVKALAAIKIGCSLPSMQETCLWMELLYRVDPNLLGATVHFGCNSSLLNKAFEWSLVLVSRFFHETWGMSCLEWAERGASPSTSVPLFPGVKGIGAFHICVCRVCQCLEYHCSKVLQKQSVIMALPWLPCFARVQRSKACWLITTFWEWRKNILNYIIYHWPLIFYHLPSMSPLLRVPTFLSLHLTKK